MPANRLPARTEPAPDSAEELTPRFFLNPAFDAAAGEEEWWLDLGRIDIPTTRACNSFTPTPQP